VLAGDQGAAADTTESIDASGGPGPVEDANPRSGVANPTDGRSCEPAEKATIRAGDHQLGQRRFDARHPVGADLLAEDEEAQDS